MILILADDTNGEFKEAKTFEVEEVSYVLQRISMSCKESDLQSRTKRLGQQASSPLPPLTMLIIG